MSEISEVSEVSIRRNMDFRDFYHTMARSKLQTPRTNFCIRNFRGVRSFDLAIILLL